MKQLFDFAMTDKTNRRGYVDLGKLSEEEIAKFGKKVVCFLGKQFENLHNVAYELMNELNPKGFPSLY